MSKCTNSCYMTDWVLSARTKYCINQNPKSEKTRRKSNGLVVASAVLAVSVTFCIVTSLYFLFGLRLMGDAMLELSSYIHTIRTVFRNKVDQCSALAAETRCSNPLCSVSSGHNRIHCQTNVDTSKIHFCRRECA